MVQFTDGFALFRVGIFLRYSLLMAITIRLIARAVSFAPLSSESLWPATWQWVKFTPSEGTVLVRAVPVAFLLEELGVEYTRYRVDRKGGEQTTLDYKRDVPPHGSESIWSVDPVDTSCTPAACSPRASSTTPVLS